MILCRVELATIRNLSGPNDADNGLGGVASLEIYILGGMTSATVWVD